MTPSIKEIATATAAFYHISLVGLLSRNHSYAYSRPRQIVMYLAMELTNRSSVYIGRAMDRHHASVLHAHKVVSERMARDAELGDCLAVIAFDACSAAKRRMGAVRVLVGPILAFQKPGANSLPGASDWVVSDGVWMPDTGGGLVAAE